MHFIDELMNVSYNGIVKEKFEDFVIGEKQISSRILF
jgi:hypothetical protein